MKTIREVQDCLESFVNERDWQPFQSPKNLAMALTGEVGELVEHFQWITQAESENLEGEVWSEVKDEMADVFIYLIRMADKLNIDLIEAAENKIEKNALKYPIDKARGNQLKYSKL